MATLAAEDPIIARRLKELRYDRIRRGLRCGIRSGVGSGECWCRGMMRNGNALPCPPEADEYGYPTTLMELDF